MKLFDRQREELEKTIEEKTNQITELSEDKNQIVLKQEQLERFKSNEYHEDDRKS